MSDQPMPDAEERPAETNAQSETPGDAPLASRIRVLSGAQPDATSFQFENEDHTLGNALRYIIMKNPLVEFCGYSMPHPAEPKMNLRIQTAEGYTAFEALEKGLNDLMDLCDVVADKFTTARMEYGGNQ